MHGLEMRHAFYKVPLKATEHLQAFLLLSFWVFFKNLWFFYIIAKAAFVSNNIHRSAI